MNEEQPMSEQINEPVNQEAEKAPESVGAVVNEPETTQVAPVEQQVNPTASASSSQVLTSETKVFAAISYLSVLFVIPWIIKKDHPFVAFHLKQGMGLFVAEVIVWIGLWLVESFLTTLFSYRAIGVTMFLGKIAWLVFGAISVAGFYFAIKGITKKIPYLEVITKYLKI